jgi:hypothetical protein
MTQFSSQILAYKTTWSDHQFSSQILAYKTTWLDHQFSSQNLAYALSKDVLLWMMRWGDYWQDFNSEETELESNVTFNVAQYGWSFFV